MEFRQPLVKLVADIPGDAKVREKLEDMQMSDGYTGSCGIVDSDQRDRGQDI